MKKLFVTLLLLFTFNTNIFAEDSIKYDVNAEVQRKAAISYAIIGPISMAVGFPLIIKARNADDLSMGFLGAGLAGGGIMLSLVSVFLFISLSTGDISYISESNPIIKHLQLGILPNAKSGYAGFKFNF